MQAKHQSRSHGEAAVGSVGLEPPTTLESIWVQPTGCFSNSIGCFSSLCCNRGDLQRGRGPQSSPSTAELGMDLNLLLQSEPLPKQRSGAPDWEVGEGGTIFKLSCVLFCICLCFSAFLVSTGKGYGCLFFYIILLSSHQHGGFFPGSQGKSETGCFWVEQLLS